MAEQALRSRTFWTLIRYASVGAINTIVGLGVMLLLASAGFHYVLYTAAGYFVAFSTSYVLNARFTFQVNKLPRTRFLLFLSVNGTLLLITEVLQISLIEVILVPELAGVASGLVFYTVVGFFLNRRIVFRATQITPAC